ncbi:LysM peptidoglycan-binding domain-containing protein [Arthrobacter sp. NA-172]|uniref:LysM peptidoglycan-binding domain-containing protein n=1 Tax=Arthrobacter sp. NA-172 TaxID=3367524 RepID=UPI0037552CB0
MPNGWKAAALAVLLSAGLTACTYGAPSAETATAKPTVKPTAGPTVADSFGNVDFYTTVSGDSLAGVAGSFHLSERKLDEFNLLQPGDPLPPGTKLRLIPAPGPMLGAKGTATTDPNGIATSYVIEPNDTLGGITYRFGITEEQLAEANKVPYTYEKGNTYFVRAGNNIRLQKNPVDSRSGAGKTVYNPFGQGVFYTTVDGDSFDSIGYKFRSTTAQLMLYNPSLVADKPIPAGSKLRLIPGDLKIEGAQGTFTADADGIPLTYTTAAGDTERQVSFRFGVSEQANLESANRPLTGTNRVWYDFTDLPSGELTPGQTISLALDKPIHK